MLKLLVPLLLLQTAAHVLTVIQSSFGFIRENYDNSVMWGDGRVVPQERLVEVGAKSMVLGVEDGEPIVLTFKNSFNINPVYKGLTLYIVSEKEIVDRNYERLLEALIMIRTHYEAQQDTPKNLMSYYYPGLDFAILDLSLKPQEAPSLQNNIEILSENPTPEIKEITKPAKAVCNFKLGDQVKFLDTDEPLIFLQQINKKSAKVRSTLTGSVATFKLKSLKPIPIERQMPSTLKLSFNGKYKYLMEGSGVLYVPKSKILKLECILKSFDDRNRAILHCDSTEYKNVEWSEIWPAEARQILPFLPQNLTNNVDNSSQIVIPAKRKLPVNRKDEKIFRKGDQVLLKDNGNIPFIHLSRDGTRLPCLLNTLTGAFLYSKEMIERIPEDLAIPMDKKVIVVSDEITFKYITVGSSVLYYHEANSLFYPCSVYSFASNPSNLCLKLRCLGLKEVNDSQWKDLFPIEAYHLVKGKAKVFGFENEEVTMEGLEFSIKIISYLFMV